VMTDPKTPETLSLMLAAQQNARAELDFVIRPQIEHLRMSYDASTKFADQAIKSGFALNGGGLVLLSGFAALFKVDPTLAVKEIVVTVSLLISGLICASVTSFLAYRSARVGVDIANHRIAGSTLIHLNAGKQPDADPFSDPRVKSQYDAAARLQSDATRDAKLAVRVGLVGLAAFVFGALIGGWTLMARVGTAK